MMILTPGTMIASGIDNGRFLNESAVVDVKTNGEIWVIDMEYPMNPPKLWTLSSIIKVGIFKLVKPAYDAQRQYDARNPNSFYSKRM